MNTVTLPASPIAAVVIVEVAVVIVPTVGVYATPAVGRALVLPISGSGPITLSVPSSPMTATPDSSVPAVVRVWIRSPPTAVAEAFAMSSQCDRDGELPGLPGRLRAVRRHLAVQHPG